MTSLQTVGLVLDLSGAIILAVPDFGPVRHWFRFGKLQNARQLLRDDGVRKGDPGFNELYQLIPDEAILSRADTSDSPTEIFVHSPSAGRQYSVPSGIQSKSEYLVIKRGVELGHHMDFCDYGVVSRRLQSAIETCTRYIRSLGLLLLIIGFSLQLIAVSGFITEI